MLRKIFNFFGYTFSRSHKSTSLDEIIKLRLKFIPVEILLDVGANQGKFTEYLKDEFQQYYLFEPNPILFKKLKNYFKNKKFQIFDFGLGKNNEKVKLNLTNDSAKSLSSIKKQTAELKNNFRNTEVIGTFDVEIKRLDNFLDTQNLQNSKIFLKIDTQGNDFETLIGLGKYISNIKFLKIEMPCIELYETNYNHWDILNYLKNNNFKPVYFENISRTKKGQLIEYDCFFEKNDI
ncbi:FkbM family methyltransferase [Candidatus Pelagibacter sp.]|nr:FkbM family methyltransferase [Candidatus Pelagibacter sp.]